MVGGAGLDTVDYSSRRAPVSVTLDDVENDGAAGEGDNVLFVDRGRDRRQRGRPPDRRRAAQPPDAAATGATRWSAARAATCSTAGPGADDIDGGDGRDMLIGGAGLDTLRGGAANDVIDVRDGRRDAVECGDGIDRVLRDKVDRIDSDCERLVPAKP